MKRDEIANTIIFWDDDDMADFCILPQFDIITKDNGKKYYDWNFTSDYIDAVAANTEFLIRDQNSRILKDQLIDYKGCTKPVNVTYDIEWAMQNAENTVKANKKEEKRKLKAQIEKHINPEQ